MRTKKYCYDFRGVHTIPTVGSGDGGPWAKAITGAAPPTVQGVSGGGVALALTSASQAQNACLYQGDVLPFDIDDIVRVEWIAALSVALSAAAASMAFGLTSARNDAIDSITEAALFRSLGTGGEILVETDDGTNNNDDIATGQTLGTAYKRFAIDFMSGVKTQSPPAASLGGKAALQFLMGNARGPLRPVAVATAFDMSNYAGNLQLFHQIQKTSATDVGTLNILQAEIEVRLPA